MHNEYGRTKSSHGGKMFIAGTQLSGNLSMLAGLIGTGVNTIGSVGFGTSPHAIKTSVAGIVVGLGLNLGSKLIDRAMSKSENDNVLYMAAGVIVGATVAWNGAHKLADHWERVSKKASAPYVVPAPAQPQIPTSLQPQQ